MWYSDLYRRHLCDMHIDDWDDAFLKEFSPETYVNALQTAGINYAMLYLQSHVGLCYYPTKTGVMHRSFIGREDAMRRTAELCHEKGIRVCGYYSLIYNTREHDRHPEWRMLTEKGVSRREDGGEADDLAFASKKNGRYGLCCLNDREYTQFVFDQIDEMLDYFELDALFFDMPFWPHTCYCEKCKARWAKEVGGEIPLKTAAGSPAYLLLNDKKYEWMGKWIQEIAAYVKSRRPDLPVEFNFAGGISWNSSNGCGLEVNNASDYTGGDLYGSILHHSFTCKFYKNVTRSQPFEYMFSRCKPALRSHTLTKTLDEMKTAVSLVAAHHGATLLIDAIDPVGTMDRRIYERMGEVFGFQKPYEPYFRGEMAEDVGIYYGIKSKFDPTKENRTSVTCGVSTAQTLVRHHIPFGVTGIWHGLAPYKAIIAPVLSAAEEADNARLCAYVKDGGVLYLSGAGNAKLVEELTGGKVTGRMENSNLYIAPKEEYRPCFGDFNAKYPLPWDGTAPMLEDVAAEDVAATFTFPYTGRGELAFASIHSDPPGKPTQIPAVVVRRYGKGTVIWSAVALENGETEEYGDVMWNLVSASAGLKEPSFRSDAPENVELTLFESDGEKLLSALVLTDAATSHPVSPFTVEVKSAAQPKAVTLLPENTPVEFTCTDGYVKFKARKLHIFDMYRLEF